MCYTSKVIRPKGHNIIYINNNLSPREQNKAMLKVAIVEFKGRRRLNKSNSYSFGIPSPGNYIILLFFTPRL